VNTGEGIAPAGDGTANGTTAITVNNASVTGVNFGIEQPPTAGGTVVAGQANPGGTTSVPIPATAFTTGSSDPAPGAVVSYTITAFPSNASSITIGATTYTLATFPAGGVVIPAAQIGTVSVDPIDGSVTVNIPFRVTDEAGQVSANIGNAQIPFTGLTLSGTVFSDPNGSEIQDGAEVGTNGGGLNAVLVNGAGQVVAVAPVAANGSFVFNNIAVGTYSVLITTATPAVGSPAPTPILPVGYIPTGENLNGAIDPTTNATLTNIAVTTASVTGVNFGIERPPTAAGLTLPSQTNPGGTVSVAIPASAFTTNSSDPDGTIVSYVFTQFPTNATSITINGTTYTAATFPGTGVTIPAAQIGTVSVDPINGSVTVGIPFAVIDNAGEISPTVGTVAVPFIGLNVSGTVFSDPNGSKLQDGAEAGTNGGGLNAVLVDNAGNVLAVAPVLPAGTYQFTNVPAGTYSVLITTATPGAGTPAPTPVIPAGYVRTGENINGAIDPLSNAVLTGIVLTTTDATGLNFGIEQPPIAGGSNAPGQANPGGTTLVPVPATAFTTGSTDSDGVITSYTITAFPSSATSITINGTNYTTATFPVGGVVVPAAQIGSILVDPVAGSVTVDIPFTVTDNAGVVSGNSGTASIPFTGITVSGSVFNDTNGTTNALIDGAGTNAASPTLTAYLVDTAGNVVASDTVAANGNYLFSNVANGVYTVVLSNSGGVAAGQSAPGASLPAGWTNTAEGTTPAGDGTANGSTAVSVNNASVTNVNFGIEQPPIAGGTIVGGQANPGGNTSVPVPAIAFTTGSSDTTPGTIVSYTLTAFPSSAQTITVGATTYTAATFPPGGVVIPAAQIGTISVNPVDGSVTVNIPFNVTDDAGLVSALPGNAQVPFTGLTLSGTVFSDPNGSKLQDGAEAGINAGGLNAVLVNGAGQVVAVAPVGANGSYVFNNLAIGTYSVLITTANPAPGAAAPAPVIPAGYVVTGENFAGAIDPTSNATLTGISVSTASVTGANFGLEQPPTAGGTAVGGQANPGGATSVPVPAAAFTTGSTDTDGAIVSYTITAFPSNAESITVGATTYTAATFPAGGVTIPAAQIGTVSVNPVDGSVTVNIPFTVTDNAGVVSPLPGNASLPFTGLTVSGTVFSDPNGSEVQDGAEVGTNGGGLNAVLVNAANQVVAVVPVGANGTYVFNNVAIGTYSVLTTTATPALGSTPAAPVLPTGYIPTGENINGAIDPTTDSKLTGINVTTASVTGLNFGIERPPTAGGTNAAPQPNPGGTTNVAVPATAFTTNSSDPDGTIASYVLLQFPSNVTSITVGATTYTAATFPGIGVTIPAAQIGTVSVDPIDGSVLVSIPFAVVDNAGEISPNIGNATLPFTGLTVSGTVFADVNGSKIQDGAEVGSNGGGLNAVLVNASNQVVAVTPVGATGAYTFNNVAVGTYSVLITTATPATGTTPAAPVLPTDYVSTGENVSGTPDATVNATITGVNVSTAPVTGLNFGIEQAPVAGGVAVGGQSNPGGTTSVPVPASAFTTNTSDADGTVVSYTITAFPALRLTRRQPSRRVALSYLRRRLARFPLIQLMAA
jgi:hypothetical protein